MFGKSAKTNEEKDIEATRKMSDPKYSMPQWCPWGLTRSQKRKMQRLRAKQNREKEADKIFNDTYPLFLPPQKYMETKVC